jgi:hypothetical protein
VDILTKSEKINADAARALHSTQSSSLIAYAYEGILKNSPRQLWQQRQQHYLIVASRGRPSVFISQYDEKIIYEKAVTILSV